MATAIQVVYALVLAVLIVLFVALGVRTFFPEPEYPTNVGPPVYDPAISGRIYCEAVGDCYKDNVLITEDTSLTDREAEYVAQLQEQDRANRDYQQDLDNYHRAVFAGSMILGVAAIAAGLFLYRRLDGIPLGLMLGGLGVLIYGWIEASDDFSDEGPGLAFAVVTIGLVVVLGAGYYFLGRRRPDAGASGGNPVGS